jgi:penicillin-binding protein 2
MQKFSFSRRSFIITIFNLVIFLIIAIRLFFLQIIKSKEYKTLSNKNSIKLIFLEPKRGMILDRHDKAIATNQNNYKLIMYKQREYDPLETLQKLYKIIKYTPSEKQEIERKVAKALLVSPIILKENLTWKEVADIESESHNLPGIFTDKGYNRFCPDGAMFAHVIGYMGQASPKEIEEYSLFYNQDFKVGKAAIEKTQQLKLMGKFGMKRVEVDAHKRIVRELSEIKSISGNNVKLFLNHDIQAISSKAVADKNAAVIVLDVLNGQVLSMLSTPSFNPNLFSQGIGYNEWKRMVNNPAHPLTNKTISNLYPPGSVWKVVVALAVLESGIPIEEKIYCSGGVKIGNKRFKCWKETGHGEVNLINALATSCNSYFYQMGQKVGVQKIHEVAKKLGFGQKTGIDLPGELPGINPNKEWKTLNYGLNWLIGDTVNSSIGQGFTLVSPIQLAVMIARLASGKAILPSVIYKDALSFPDLEFNPEHLKIVREGLYRAVNTPKGTGFALRIKEEEFQMAGKTGTAQVISKDTSEQSGIAFAKHHKSHSIFTGFAPFHNPRYATAVVVEHGGWGAQAAAPVGREILYNIQKTLPK